VVFWLRVGEIKSMMEILLASWVDVGTTETLASAHGSEGAAFGRSESRKFTQT
jgi:hypothetical protein